MAQYSADDKLQWEVKKLEAETKNLNRPFLRQPGSWLAVGALMLSVAGNISQLSAAKRSWTLGEIKHEKLDLDTIKLGEREALLERSVEEKRQRLADASRELQSQELRLNSLQAQVTSASNAKETILQEIAEFKRSVSAVQDINDTTARDLVKLAAPRISPSAAELQTARRMYHQGFAELAEGQFDAAAREFQASEEEVHGYHQAYELARLIRRRSGDLADPIKRKDVLAVIVSKYSQFAPSEAVDRLRVMAK